MKKIFNVFLTTSSLPSFAITLAYLGQAHKASGRRSDIPYETFPLFIPLMYGLAGILNYYIIKQFCKNASLIVGMIFGLLFSIIGRGLLSLPTKIFGFNEDNAWYVHIIAMIMYALIFRIVVTPLTLYANE